MNDCFKVGLLGRDGVGKTSIVLRLVENYFSRSFKQSSGVFRVDHKLCVDSHNITLNVNDFPGNLDTESSFAETIKMLDAVLIVTDNNYSDSNSRVEITLLIDRLRRLFAFKSIIDYPYFALVGNHFSSDDEESFSPVPLRSIEFFKSSSSLSPVGKTISEETSKEIEETILSSELTDGELISREIAKAAKIDFYRVSAYTGFGILEMFESVANRLLTQQDQSKQLGQSKQADIPTPIPLRKSKRYYCFCIPRK